jgi:hypothetical protein
MVYKIGFLARSLWSAPWFSILEAAVRRTRQKPKLTGAVAPCKKMVIGEKAGEKPVERTKIPGLETI